MKIKRLRKAQIPLRYSIFIQLMLIFIIIITPLFFIFGTIYQLSASMIKKEVSGIIHSQMLSYTREFSEELQKIKYLQDILMSDTDLSYLSIMPDTLSPYEVREHVDRVQKQLTMLSYSSNNIAKTKVLIPKFERTLSSGAGYSVMDPEEFQFLMEQVNQGITISVKDSRIRIISTTTFGYSEEQDTPFIIVSELSLRELKKSLKQFETDSKSSTLLVDKNKSAVVYNNGDPTVQKVLSQWLAKEPDLSSLSEEMLPVTWDGEQYLVLSQECSDNDFLLLHCLSEKDLFASLNVLKIWMVIFIGCAVGVVVLYSILSYRTVKKPLDRLVQLFGEVEAGNLDVHAEYRKNDEFNFIYQHFNQMIEKIKSLIDQVYKQKIYAQRSELKKLQSQINPHFLYNSFFILSIMARNGDLDLLEEFTNNLGEYFRFITKNKEDEIVLAEEIKHAQTYAQIQSARFSNRIRIRFDELPPEFMYRKAPRLILQPILENSFVHGLEKKLQNGLLEIQYKTSPNLLCMIISDNSGEMTDELIQSMNEKLQAAEDMQAETSGIVNIHRRIQLSFGINSGIRVEKNMEDGLTVYLTIQFPGETVNLSG